MKFFYTNHLTEQKRFAHNFIFRLIILMSKPRQKFSSKIFKIVEKSVLKSMLRSVVRVRPARRSFYASLVIPEPVKHRVSVVCVRRIWLKKYVWP